jgi:hypothetical protein
MKRICDILTNLNILFTFQSIEETKLLIEESNYINTVEGRITSIVNSIKKYTDINTDSCYFIQEMIDKKLAVYMKSNKLLDYYNCKYINVSLKDKDKKLIELNEKIKSCFYKINYNKDRLNSLNQTTKLTKDTINGIFNKLNENFKQLIDLKFLHIYIEYGEGLLKILNVIKESNLPINKLMSKNYDSLPEEVKNKYSNKIFRNIKKDYKKFKPYMDSQIIEMKKYTDIINNTIKNININDTQDISTYLSEKYTELTKNVNESIETYEKIQNNEHVLNGIKCINLQKDTLISDVLTIIPTYTSACQYYNKFLEIYLKNDLNLCRKVLNNKLKKINAIIKNAGNYIHTVALLLISEVYYCYDIIKNYNDEKTGIINEELTTLLNKINNIVINYVDGVANNDKEFNSEIECSFELMSNFENYVNNLCYKFKNDHNLINNDFDTNIAESKFLQLRKKYEKLHDIYINCVSLIYFNGDIHFIDKDISQLENKLINDIKINYKDEENVEEKYEGVEKDVEEDMEKKLKTNLLVISEILNKLDEIIGKYNLFSSEPKNSIFIFDIERLKNKIISLNFLIDEKIIIIIHKKISKCISFNSNIESYLNNADIEKLNTIIDNIKKVEIDENSISSLSLCCSILHFIELNVYQKQNNFNSSLNQNDVYYNNVKKLINMYFEIQNLNIKEYDKRLIEIKLEKESSSKEEKEKYYNMLMEKYKFIKLNKDAVVNDMIFNKYVNMYIIKKQFTFNDIVNTIKQSSLTEEGYNEIYNTAMYISYLSKKLNDKFNLHPNEKYIKQYDKNINLLIEKYKEQTVTINELIKLIILSNVFILTILPIIHGYTIDNTLEIDNNVDIISTETVNTSIVSVSFEGSLNLLENTMYSIKTIITLLDNNFIDINYNNELKQKLNNNVSNKEIGLLPTSDDFLNSLILSNFSKSNYIDVLNCIDSYIKRRHGEVLAIKNNEQKDVENRVKYIEALNNLFLDIYESLDNQYKSKKPLFAEQFKVKTESKTLLNENVINSLDIDSLSKIDQFSITYYDMSCRFYNDTQILNTYGKLEPIYIITIAQNFTEIVSESIKNIFLNIFEFYLYKFCLSCDEQLNPFGNKIKQSINEEFKNINTQDINKKIVLIGILNLLKLLNEFNTNSSIENENYIDTFIGNLYDLFLLAQCSICDESFCCNLNDIINNMVDYINKNQLDLNDLKKIYNEFISNAKGPQLIDIPNEKKKAIVDEINDDLKAIENTNIKKYYIILKFIKLVVKNENFNTNKIRDMLIKRFEKLQSDITTPVSTIDIKKIKKEYIPTLYIKDVLYGDCKYGEPNEQCKMSKFEIMLSYLYFIYVHLLPTLIMSKSGIYNKYFEDLATDNINRKREYIRNMNNMISGNMIIPNNVDPIRFLKNKSNVYIHSILPVTLRIDKDNFIQTIKEEYITYKTRIAKEINKKYKKGKKDITEEVIPTDYKNFVFKVSNKYSNKDTELTINKLIKTLDIFKESKSSDAIDSFTKGYIFNIKDGDKTMLNTLKRCIDNKMTINYNLWKEANYSDEVVNSYNTNLEAEELTMKKQMGTALVEDLLGTLNPAVESEDDKNLKRLKEINAIIENLSSKSSAKPSTSGKSKPKAPKSSTSGNPLNPSTPNPKAPKAPPSNPLNPSTPNPKAPKAPPSNPLNPSTPGASGTPKPKAPKSSTSGNPLNPSTPGASGTPNPKAPKSSTSGNPLNPSTPGASGTPNPKAPKAPPSNPLNPSTPGASGTPKPKAPPSNPLNPSTPGASG